MHLFMSFRWIAGGDVSCEVPTSNETSCSMKSWLTRRHLGLGFALGLRLRVSFKIWWYNTRLSLEFSVIVFTLKRATVKASVTT